MAGMDTPDPNGGEAWPDLALDTLMPTTATLLLWSQIVGKVRLARTPCLNHSWHVPFYVSARGLVTALIPHSGGGFELEFDFIDQGLAVRTTAGGARRIALRPMS